MKVIVLFVVIAVVFVAADAAYALGGGGHNGDGRRADMQNIKNSVVAADGAYAPGDGDGRQADVQNIRNSVGNSDNANRHNGQTGISNRKATASVPEPATLLLLSLGVIGTAGMRRKLK